jgi:Fe-S-cluster-containing dehydrogenase component
MTAQACFTIDLDRCTGCSACRIACELANPVSAGVHWRSVATFNSPRWSGATVLHWSLACNHCGAPTCLAGCPAGAYTKDVATGAVVLDRDRCIGCRYCSWVCPYAAPQLDESSGTMEKCTFCLDRQRRGEAPACASACPTGALGFTREPAPAGPASPWPPGFPDAGTRPALRVTPRRRGTAPPEMTAASTMAPAPAVERASLRRGLAAEWPLLAFSFAATVLVAAFSASALGGPALPLSGFLALAAAAMAVATFHLGRPLRAWRALAGLRTSWVSREIAAFSAFVALGAAALLTGTAQAAPGWIAAALGVAALLAVDMVYRVRGQAVAAIPHSAMATLTWALLTAALTGAAGATALVAIVKVVLYQQRKVRGLGVRSWQVSAVRLVVGLLVPLVLWPPGGGPLPLPLLICLFAGELIDRAELYAELAFVTPRRQAARDLAVAIAVARRPA